MPFLKIIENFSIFKRDNIRKSIYSLYGFTVPSGIFIAVAVNLIRNYVIKDLLFIDTFHQIVPNLILELQKKGQKN